MFPVTNLANESVLIIALRNDVEVLLINLADNL